MNTDIQQIRKTLSELNINPSKGLGEDLFLLISSLVPITNVDLLVYNEKGQFLLTRRDDPHCGMGWHVPGGCVRFKETFDERIKKVASNELGLRTLTYDKSPIRVFEIFFNEYRNIDNQDERAHFITLVFKCFAPADYVPDNAGRSESDPGFIKWFDKLPSDLLPIQNCYKEILL